MRIKIWILVLILLLILQIVGYSSNYFGEPKPLNDSVPLGESKIAPLIFVVVFAIGGFAFLIAALFSKAYPFEKKLIIITAVTALSGAAAMLIDLLKLLIAYPIIIGIFVVLLIYAIKVLIDIFSINKQQANKTEVNE